MRVEGKELVMAGYMLIEKKYLPPYKPAGRCIIPNKRRIGFLDFLRELGDEEFPYNEESSLLVVGLEDVLLHARPNHESKAKMIHQKLNHAAGAFEKRNCGTVQILFRNELIRGAKLYVKHPTLTLPVYLIFGSPSSERDENENVFYPTSFHISGS